MFVFFLTGSEFCFTRTAEGVELFLAGSSTVCADRERGERARTVKAISSLSSRFPLSRYQSLLARMLSEIDENELSAGLTIESADSILTGRSDCYAGGFFSSGLGLSTGLAGILKSESSIGTSSSILSITIWFTICPLILVSIEKGNRTPLTGL